MDHRARSGTFLVAPADAAALTDEELVRRVTGGDASSFEVLMRRYNQRLYRIARSLVGPNDAEDVVQHAYLDAFVNLAQFEGRAAISTWLARIVANRALTVLASAQTRRTAWGVEGDVDALESPAALDPERLTTRDELLSALETTIAELPDGYRAAFVLRDVENVSTREAAEVLGITEDAVKVRLHRARALVKDRLGREVPELVAEVLSFGLARCDRMVLAVLATIAPHVVIGSRGGKGPQANAI